MAEAASAAPGPRRRPASNRCFLESDRSQRAQRSRHRRTRFRCSRARRPEAVANTSQPPLHLLSADKDSRYLGTIQILLARSSRCLAISGEPPAAPHTDRLTPVSNPSMSSVNQPVVQRTDYVLDVSSAAAGSASEQQRLANGSSPCSSLRAIGSRSTSRRLCRSGEPQGRCRRRRAIRAFSSRTALRSRRAAYSPGIVRVIVSRTPPPFPGCPNWADPASARRRCPRTMAARPTPISPR
jgi:hypothetical protein